MKSYDFIECVSKFFEAWFLNIKSEIDKGNLQITGEYSFPDFLRVGESSQHFIVELIGARNITDPYKYKIQRPKTTEKIENAASFLNPGYEVNYNSTAVIMIESYGNSFSNLTFSTKFDREEFEKRINIFLNPSQLQANFDAKIPVNIAESADKLIFRNIDLVRFDNHELFFKRITTAIVFRKIIKCDELVQWINAEAIRMLQPPFSDILGLNVNYSVSKENFAIQLLGLTQQQVSEKIIDDFIKKNANFFAEALGYEKAIAQQRLKIIDGIGLNGDYLQPDYLMLKKDGTYDILDLKKALTHQITVGSRNRLRFSSYVNELIGQLEGYRRYFASNKNREWVQANLGITIAENPRLMGVVGNHNNFIRSSVDLVSEAYKDEITIIGYPEIISLLRKL